MKSVGNHQNISLNTALTGRLRLHIAIGTLFGVGFVPKMPGTAGSFAALLLLFVPVVSIVPVVLAAVVVAFVVGLIIIPSLEARYGADPACVVLDEALGIWIVFATPIVPHTIGWIALGFVLFRVFDIWKPFPIRWLNAQRGSVFVLLDDVVAAVFASCILHGCFLLVP
jgi:phosphatidylglycerophosphatase A